MTTHNGAIISINKNGHQFTVVPSKYDFGIIDGILGNFNGNSKDDFIVDQVSYIHSLTKYFELYKYQTVLLKIYLNKLNLHLKVLN